MQYLFGSEISLLAFRFRDYIRAQFNVEVELREINDKKGKRIDIFLCETSPHFQEIVAEKDQFLADPFNKKYEQASWTSGDIRSSTYPLKAFLSHSGLQSCSFSELLRTGKFTLSITTFCIVVYFCQLTGYEDWILTHFHYPDNAPASGEIWRYLSHVFVHLSPLHILFNLVWWLFAHTIERHFGTWKILQLFLISALVTGFAQNIVSGPYFFGLSGVVYAVLGYVLIYDKLSPTRYFNLPIGFAMMLIVAILTGFISPFFGIEMGNTAHITGLMAGLLIGWATFKRTVKR